jgi:peptidoglycan-associated lipoprotein
MTKFASPRLFLILVGAAALVAGCAKKPVRPEPSATVLGQGAGGGLSPTEVPTTADQNSGLQARDTGPGFDANGQLRGAMDSVYFDFDRSSIKAGEEAKLQAAKDYLDKNPQYRMLLEGHCDWHGTAEYNLALGDRRANEAKKYLINLGITADRLETLSKGSEEAKKGGDDATAAKDRRVDFVVLKGSGADSAGAPPPAAGP